MSKILILGASGMLGSMLVDHLSKAPGITVTGTLRDPGLRSRFQRLYGQVRWADFDYTGSGNSFALFDGHDWILNAIGVTKPLIRDTNDAEICKAIQVNSMLPHEIARAAGVRGIRVLQIATDCVYSGTAGAYTENSPHDALDVYGKTKSLGEVYHNSVSHLRCSIIGPEMKDFKFLIEWFRRQPAGARVNGFINHRWNGITTLQFARICEGIIRYGFDLPHIQHIVPSGSLTKAQMLVEFATAYKRSDIRIAEIEASTALDRTLATNHSDLNDNIWKAAGYDHPPSVVEMIQELARYGYAAAAGV